jgi:FkbM family methyltransferase
MNPKIIKHRAFQKLRYRIARIVPHLPNDGISMLDIGAFNGQFTSIMARYLPVRSFLFEPVSDHFQTCLSVIEGCPSCSVQKLAISNISGQDTIFRFSKNNQHNIVGKKFLTHDLSYFSAREKIHTTSLDEWMEVNHHPSIDLVKIDVEGTQHRVFEGGFKFIQKQKPIIVSEYSPTDPPYIMEWYERLRDIGYKIPERQSIERMTDVFISTNIGFDLRYPPKHLDAPIEDGLKS